MTYQVVKKTYFGPKMSFFFLNVFPKKKNNPTTFGSPKKPQLLNSSTDINKIWTRISHFVCTVILSYYWRIFQHFNFWLDHPILRSRSDHLNLVTTTLVYEYCPQYSYKTIYEYCTILVYEYSCHILVLYKLENKMTMKMYFW